LATGVDTLIIAADFAQTAVDIDTRSVNAGLAGGADMATVAAVVTVDMGVDALTVADRPVVAALTRSARTDLAGVAGVAAGAAIARIGIKADTLLIAAGVPAKQPLALRSHSRCSAINAAKQAN
jgi:hypothetical protein